MKNISFLLIIPFLISVISGCVHQPNALNYQSELSEWVGHSEEELYSAWGYPNTTYSIDANTFVATYIKTYKEPIDADTAPYTNSMSYSAMEVPSYGIPTPQGVYYCKTSFIIKDDEIIDFNTNGDDCVR